MNQFCLLCMSRCVPELQYNLTTHMHMGNHPSGSRRNSISFLHPTLHIMVLLTDMSASSTEALFTEVLAACERDRRAACLHLVYHYRREGD